MKTGLEVEDPQMADIGDMKFQRFPSPLRAGGVTPFLPRSIQVKGAEFLNDMANAENRHVCVTDTGAGFGRGLPRRNARQASPSGSAARR